MSTEENQSIQDLSSRALVAGIVGLLLSLFGVLGCFFIPCFGLAPLGLAGSLYAVFAGRKASTLAQWTESDDHSGTVGIILGAIGSVLGALGTLALGIVLLFFVIYVVVIVGGLFIL